MAPSEETNGGDGGIHLYSDASACLSFCFSTALCRASNSSSSICARRDKGQGSGKGRGMEAKGRQVWARAAEPR